MSFIHKESIIELSFGKAAAFFGHPLPTLDEKVQAALVKHNEDKVAVRRYLAALRIATEVNTVEVPLCLQEEAPSASPPKPKATAAGSKKKSPTKPRKTKASSTTSQPKDA